MGTCSIASQSHECIGGEHGADLQKHGTGVVCRSISGRLTMGSRVRKSRYGMPRVSTKLCLSAYEHQASVAYTHFV